jgi:hypothetical protein
MLVSRSRSTHGRTRAPLPLALVASIAVFTVIASAARPLAGATLTRTEDARISWAGSLPLADGAGFGGHLDMGEQPAGTCTALVSAPAAGAVALLTHSASAGWQQTGETHQGNAQQLPVDVDTTLGVFALLDPWSGDTTIYDTAGQPLVSGLGDDVYAVASRDDVLAVGEATFNGGRGKVTIYERDGAGSWILAKTFSGLSPGDLLGHSLAIGDSIVVAGVPGAGANGEVKVYVRGSSWNLWQTLASPASTQINAYFGFAVALDGDWLAVGSPFLDRTTVLPGQPPVIDVGGVYLYQLDAFVFESRTLLRPPEVTDYHRFGWSVALRGIALAAGAPAHNADDDRGHAFLYLRFGSVWRAHLRLLDSTAQNQSSLGSAVAIGDPGVLVGAANASVNGSLQGAVLFYQGIAPLFLDGFENGNLSAWSGSEP